MKKIVVLLGMVFCVYSIAFAGASRGKGTLELRIKGFQNSLGNAMIALDNSKKGYNSKKPLRNIKEKIIHKKSTVFIKDLSYGEYAIKVFHDKNNNMELDTNFVGIPKEAYGFSNNARGAFGPPAFEKVKFLFNKKNSTQEITVK